MSRGRNPVAAQRKLRSELRRQRNVSNLTQREVADALSWSMSKVIRMETGVVGVSITDLWALLRLYGVTEPATVSELEEIARMAREKAWWDDYREYAAPELIEFIANEASASTMCQFHSFVVPGILQTPEYTRSLCKMMYDLDTEDIEHAVTMRALRRQLLTDHDGPEARFVLDEASISRSIGPSHVMRGQYDFLQEINQLPNVTIQIATFAKGVTDGMESTFTLFAFSDDREVPLVYLDQASRLVLVKRDAQEAERYRLLFDKLCRPERSSRPEELGEVLDCVLHNIGI